jgi:hypothetical protein
MDLECRRLPRLGEIHFSLSQYRPRITQARETREMLLEALRISISSDEGAEYMQNNLVPVAFMHFGWGMPIIARFL